MDGLSNQCPIFADDNNTKKNVMLKTKVLLVEDDKSLSATIKNRLEEMPRGYHVLQACQGEEGIRLWNEHHPHIIVTDLNMPIMNGWEMVQHIRTTDSQTPILIISALRTENYVVEGMAIGADNYLKKPFTMAELESYINALLRRTNGGGARMEDFGHRLGIFNFIPSKGILTNTLTEETVHLGVMPSKVLDILAANCNHVVEKKIILQQVWGNEWSGSNLNNIIMQLRGLLKADAAIVIETYRNIGCQLTVKT